MKTVIAAVSVSFLVACTRAAPPPVLTTQSLDSLLVELDTPGLMPLASIAPDWLVREATTGAVTRDGYVRFLLGDGAFHVTSSVRPEDRDTAHRILIALLALENDRAAGRCDLACQNAILRGYNLYALWSFFDASAMFTRVMALSRWDQDLSPELRTALAAFFHRFVGESRQRFAAETVRLVRKNPATDDATTALNNLANIETWSGSYALAERIYNEVLIRRGERVTDDDRVNAARAAYQAGDRVQARAHVAGAGVLTAATVEELSRMDAMVREAGELEHATSYDERLRRVQLDFELGRLATVRDQSPALIAEHPEDARPYYYLGRAAFAAFGLAEADTIMRHAGPEHRDVDFYRFALGSSFGVLMSQSLQEGSGETLVTRLNADLPRLRALDDVFATLEPDRAEWIAMALEFAAVGLADEAADRHTQVVRLRGLFDRLRERAARADATWPGNGDFARIRLVLAMLDADTARADGVIAQIASRHDASLASLMRNIVTIRTTGYRDHTGLDALAAAPGEERAGAMLEVDARALHAFAAPAATWEAIAKAYRAVPRPTDPKELARWNNNVGVAVFHAGRVSEARALWSQAEHAEFPTALINLYATADESQRPGMWLTLEPRLEKSSYQERVARRWWIRYSAKNEADEKNRLALLSEVDPEPVFPWTPLPGATLDKNIKVAIGYGAKGLQTELDVDAHVWLVLEP